VRGERPRKHKVGQLTVERFKSYNGVDGGGEADWQISFPVGGNAMTRLKWG